MPNIEGERERGGYESFGNKTKIIPSIYRCMLVLSANRHVFYETRRRSTQQSEKANVLQSVKALIGSKPIQARGLFLELCGVFLYCTAVQLLSYKLVWFYCGTKIWYKL